jgi:chorismate synthase
MTNGEPIIVRGVLKPISTLKKPLRSVDLKTKEAMQAHFERADLCAVPSAGVVGEAMLGIVLANALLKKFGGDSLEETRQNFENALKLQNRL